jgi:branched-chain amino acid aminotransferase
VLCELAGKLGIPFREQDLLPADVASAAEVLLVSTSPCVLPATRFNGAPIASGRVEPSSVHSRLLRAWSELVGLDIAEQARRFAAR